MDLPWLYEHRYNETSQHGEDGVIEAILGRIGEQTPWCVDIGANDGVLISNSHYWCGKRGWSGVMVEADPAAFGELDKVYSDRSDVYCFREFATIENSIDTILARTPCPERFDILSIDVDGMDYWLWKAVERYRPRIVVVEVNASMSPDVHFVQQDLNQRMGASAYAMTNLAADKGYELAAHLVSNCIFVDKAEFGLLGLGDNSLSRLFTSPFVPVVVSDMDGMHHILKPGPWGFSGSRVAPGMFQGEGGEELAGRLFGAGRDGGGAVYRVDGNGKAGYAAAFVQDPELFRVAARFCTRDWSRERAELESRTATATAAE